MDLTIKLGCLLSSKEMPTDRANLCESKYQLGKVKGHCSVKDTVGVNLLVDDCGKSP